MGVQARERTQGLRRRRWWVSAAFFCGFLGGSIRGPDFCSEAAGHGATGGGLDKWGGATYVMLQ